MSRTKRETMTSPVSSSDAFDALHPKVRHWIWQQGWQDLRPVQRAAIGPLLRGSVDAIISARTAAGKTEAAFLPLISRIADEPGGGFRLLYISPLKALINDQFRRLEGLCETLDIPVFRWHGDVSSGQKAQARKRPAGIVLITPESLEATFIRRGLEIGRLFGALDAVVIDELHAFIGTDRGRQLQSLLNRLDVAIDRRVTRVGLSATLGDMSLAAAFIDPDHPARVALVTEPSGGQDVRLQLRGYVQAPLGAPAAPACEQDIASKLEPLHAIAEDLFDRLRGQRHLVFAGSRDRVELLSDHLRQLSERLGVPNEFFPHHASLSREHREFVEARLRGGSLPTTAIATSTLELGIDIGDVASVAQIGPPFTVSSLRQRIGRSGRREGQSATLRQFVIEKALSADLGLMDRLRTDLVKSVAMIELMLRGWVEPPRPSAIDLSTLLHQTLALIEERGGIQAGEAWKILCVKGPFRLVPAKLYADLLRAMGAPDARLIEQAPDGTLLPGEAGERLAGHYDFYSVFASTEEYRVVHAGRPLGSLPMGNTVFVPGMTIIFSGRRWRIREIADKEKLIEVEPSSAGTPPRFEGNGGDLHDGVAAEMKRVYASGGVPAYLDKSARDLLAEARDTFARLDLERLSIVQSGGLWLLPWVGTVKMNTLALGLKSAGLEVCPGDIGLEILGASSDALRNALTGLASCPPPDPLDLAAEAATPALGKYDRYLSRSLQLCTYASQRLEPDRLPNLARDIVAGIRPEPG